MLVFRSKRDRFEYKKRIHLTRGEEYIQKNFKRDAVRQRAKWTVTPDQI